MRVFAIDTRSDAAAASTLLKLTELSDQFGLTGVLLFTGHDTEIDPWLGAQYVISNSRSLIPLVAVNPAYIHPFTAGKMLASLASFYQRRVFVNLVAGTSKHHLEAIGDAATHEERYLRLTEFSKVLIGLVSSPRPFSFSGTYYKIEKLQLIPRISESLRPEFFAAGSSDAVHSMCLQLDLLHLDMLPPDLATLSKEKKAINFGIITRESQGQALDAAVSRFPQSDENRTVFEATLRSTDATWKHRLAGVAERFLSPENGYWLSPFVNFQSDSPFIVGSYAYVARALVEIAALGVHTLILDVPNDREEYIHVSRAFSVAGISTGDVVG